ncbi:MAG: putative cell wall-binding domain, partial [Myxococcaceae bacterium]|nr:putative cell wall-binding domain [Myxococcaceae bacterium]
HTLEDLAAFGQKRVGTDGGAKAGSYVAERFRKLGLVPVEESFSFPRFDLVSSSLEVRLDAAGALEPIGHDVFEASGSGHADADLVFVGTAQKDELAGKDLTGKIALVERNRFFHRSTQLLNVQKAGAVAMLYLSVAPDNLRQVGSVRRGWEAQVAIPSVTIGAVDGARLKAAVVAGNTVHAVIDVVASVTPATGKNIVARIEGSDPEKREIVIGAHYDTWFIGSSDNGGGVAALLALAERRLKRDKPAQTIVFVAYDGEEVALYGGYDFLRRHRVLAPEKITAVLNLETPSAAGSPTLGLAHSTIPGFDEILRDADLNALYSFYVGMKTVPGLFGGIIPTDIQGIYRSGVPTATTAVDSPYYHTTADTPDKVDAPFLARATDSFDRAVDGMLEVGPTCCSEADIDLWKATVTASTTGGSVSVTTTVTDSAGGAQASTKVEATLLYDDFTLASAVAGTTDANGTVTITFPVDATPAGAQKRWVHVTAGVDFPLVEQVVAVP